MAREDGTSPANRSMSDEVQQINYPTNHAYGSQSNYDARATPLRPDINEYYPSIQDNRGNPINVMNNQQVIITSQQLTIIQGNGKTMNIS